MKILHVITSVGPLYGGPSSVVRAVSEGLAAQGCQVEVAATDANGPGRLAVPLGQPVCRNGVTYWHFRRQTRLYSVSWPLSRWMAANLARFDVLHIHGLFTFAVTCAGYWAARREVPYVLRPFGTLNRWGLENRRPRFKQASLQYIEGPILSRAAAVQYTCREEQEEAALVARVPHPVVIPNPVDFRLDRAAVSAPWLRFRYPALAGKKIVLFLSRLDPIKGIDLLLAAFARVRAKAPDAALVVAGSGEASFTAKLKAQACALGIGADVIWPGFLEGEAKQAALAEADIFVLPSYSENFGVAAVEAMAAGLPVIVSDRVGIHREMAEADAGLVVPCAEEPLADALARLLDDSRLRGQLGRNAGRFAQSFSPGGISGRLLELYSEITHSSVYEHPRS